MSDEFRVLEDMDEIVAAFDGSTVEISGVRMKGVPIRIGEIKAWKTESGELAFTTILWDQQTCLDAMELESAAKAHGG